MNPWRKLYPYSARLYKAQPYIYVVSGLVTMISLRNIAAVASGLIFISAGLVVWYMRYRYLHEFRQSRGHIEIPATFRDEASAPDLVELNWKDAFDCGHPVIDAQHRRLFGLCNLIIDRMIRKASSSEIEHKLEELIVHIEDHFCTEEAILARTQHPLSIEHQGHHSALLEKVKSLRTQFSMSAVSEKDIVRFMAYEVIAGHILKEDLKWAVVARR